MPAVLAYEFERESLKGVFFQRSRWTIGTIENIPLLVKTVVCESSFIKKLLIISYPLMWYVQHYVIVLGVILAIFLSLKLILLMPLILYILQIVISNNMAAENYNATVFEIISHCLVFPFIISAALIGGLVFVLKNKKLYFKDKILFKRI